MTATPQLQRRKATQLTPVSVAHARGLDQALPEHAGSGGGIHMPCWQLTVAEPSTTEYPAAHDSVALSPCTPLSVEKVPCAGFDSDGHGSAARNKN